MDKKIEYERIYNIVAQEVNRLDPMGLLSIDCPEDEYSGEIKEIFDKIKDDHRLKNIEDALFGSFEESDYDTEKIVEAYKVAACEIYKRINSNNSSHINYHLKTTGINMCDDDDMPDYVYDLDLDELIDRLKEGDLCSASDIAREIDYLKIGSNYTDLLDDKVYKITDKYIIFSNTSDEYANQEYIHYFDKINKTFYCLEQCGKYGMRWVVLKWKIDNDNNIQEAVIDWFDVDGKKTPQFIVNSAISKGVL